MFLHAGADRENVRVKNNVLRREPDLLDQQVVGAPADSRAPLKRIRLAAFVKRHHHHRRAIAADQLRLVQKLFLAFLERNGIDDALALQTFQAGLDDLPFRRVHHHRHLADVRLGRDEVEKLRHRGDAVNHSLVHADVNDLRTVLDLLAGDGERGLVIAGFDELGKLRRPGHVGALADVQEVGVWTHGYGIESAEPQRRFDDRHFSRWQAAHGVGNRPDMRRRGAAAAADDVEPAVLRPLAKLRREGFRRFGKARWEQRIGQSGVRIRADVNRRKTGKLLDQRAQFLRPQRAVHADAQERDVGNGIPERLDRLPGHAAVAARLDESDGGHHGNLKFEI